jgi:hypothetical protein
MLWGESTRYTKVDQSRHLETLCATVVSYLRIDTFCKTFETVEKMDEDLIYEPAHAIVAASWIGDISFFERTLTKTDNVDFESRYFGMPLSNAASRGDTEIFRRLLQQGADFNNESQASSLFVLAGFLGFEDTIELMLDLNILRFSRPVFDSAVRMAVYSSQEKIVCSPLEWGQSHGAEKSRCKMLVSVPDLLLFDTWKLMIDFPTDLNKSEKSTRYC